MMRAFTVFSGLLSAVAAAMVGSVPAHADGDEPAIPQGVFTYHQAGLPPASWTMYPMCSQTVGDLRVNMELPVGCRIHVGSDNLAVMNGGDARLTGGTWTFSQPDPVGFTCPDGQKMPLIDTYQFDITALSGTRTVSHNTQCGVDASLVKTPFTLTFKEPLPIPVDQFPIYCSPYDALRRCS